MSSVTVPAPGGAVSMRRKPRQPVAAPILLLVWLVVFVGCMGMFVYWILAEAHPLTRQPRLQVGGLTTIAVGFASLLLLVVRARVLLKLDKRVKAARGAVCLNCHTVLTREGQEGTCPTCAEPFTIAHIRDVWKKHTP